MGRISRFIPQGAFLAMSAGLLFSTTACNENPVALVDSTGALEETVPILGGNTEKLDILWMIDNSGSMCRSQGVLREGIRSFVEILGEIDLDFHIGVTTTHMEPEYNPEPLARPGYLQSQPQPLPGFSSVCHHPVDESGEPIRSDFAPVLENIEVAVSCTRDPSEWQDLLNPAHRDLECAFDSLHFGCDPGEGPTIAELFPPPGSYREIPLVLKSAEYSDASGALELDRLAEDFACMSLVGTRGYGFEMGLAAVTRAVHPEMTGGPGANPADFPNAGFIREDANTGVIFVSDENDCSHDGTLNERTSCDVHQCTIQEQLGENGAMISVQNLRNEFLENLALTKGRIEPGHEHNTTHVNNLMFDEVITASIHGRDRIANFSADGDSRQACSDDSDCSSSENCIFPRGENFEGICVSPTLTDLCVDGFEITPACQSTFGVAWSGHRYAEFISEFPVFFPDPRSESASQGDVELSQISGEICSDFSQTLDDIANLFRTEAGGCITDIYRCDGPDDTCPDIAATGEPGECTPYPTFDASDSDALFYCDSGVEVRLQLPEGEDDLSRLETTGFCEEGTINPRSFPNSCVVSTSEYQLAACEGRRNAVTIEWTNEAWFQILSGLDVSARYSRIPQRDDSTDTGGNGDDNGEDDDE